jgi:CRP-like cAMP-binding protein
MYVTLPTEFSNCESTPTIAEMRHIGQDTRLRAGSSLFLEGDEVEWLFQVKSGLLRLTRMLDDGRRQVIAFGYPGDIVGFPYNGRNHTDCDALVDSCLQPFRRSALESGESAPELHQHLLQAALREISAMQDHFMMLGRKSAVEKVASFLGVLAQRVGKKANGNIQFDLPMRRIDVADFLGVTTETVCRTLTQLRKSGVISVDNIHTIKILRPDALLALSAGGD